MTQHRSINNASLLRSIALFVMLLTVALIGSTMYRPYIYNHHSLNTGNTYSGPAGRLWGVSVTPLHRNDLFPHAETFAQVVEVPRHLPRRLRKPRKFRGIYRDVCASRASSAAFAETFAQAAQVPRHLPRRLRRSRKYHGICRDVCAGCAGFRGIYRDVCGTPANALDSVKMSVRWRLAFFLTQGAGT